MSEATVEVQAEASEMGWVDKPAFKGDPEKWVDADAYVERGRAIVPIMKANNVKLLSELTAVKSTLTEVMETNKSLRETVEALKLQGEETAKQAVKRAIENLKDQKKVALKEQDADAVVEIDEAIAALRAKETTAPATKPAAPATDPNDFTKQPWYQEWAARPENKWFGIDPIKSGYAMGIGHKYKAEGLTGKALLEKMGEETNAHFDEAPPKKGDKVEGSRGGAGGKTGGGNGKSYSDMPADARAACDRFSKMLVGPGKAHKTVEDHRKSYAAQYFAGE